jgi:hypothetical protein
MTEHFELLRYPIGKFRKPDSLSPEQIGECVAALEKFPARIRSEVEALTDAQLDTVYRPGGWTIRQVVHHCADSHMNAIIRFKLLLTEDTPTIKPYQEDLFAELEDTKRLPVDCSLKIIEGVHRRIVALLSSRKLNDYSRQYFHPEDGTTYRLDQATALYAWHCEHHLAHISSTRQRERW